MAREGIEGFYIDNDGRFDYDKDLPYVVVGVDNELAGRFPNAVAAELYLDKALERWGRIVNTTAVTDASPHSRACGVLRHEHGTDCHSNCPTCEGKNT